MIQKVRGTRDFFGEDGRRFSRVESAAAEIFRRYGIDQIRTPIFEETSLFSRSIGEATDIVSKEMYTFEDRKGRRLTLRPEGTASVVRWLVEDGVQVTDTLKLYYLGPMFRYERPQAGRYRQFHQFGVEYFGASSAAADAEVIAVGHALLSQLGLRERTALLINSLGCPECRPRYLEKLTKYLLSVAGHICEECRGRIDKNPLRCLDCKRAECNGQYADAPASVDTLCDGCRMHDDEVKKYLTGCGIVFRIQPRLVRGLDYYVRTVFEFVTTDLGAQDALIAGGRYDGLVRNLGGPDVPAVGFAGGIERLIEMLAQRPETAGVSSPASVYIVCSEDEGARPRAFGIGQRLRDAGVPVSWTLDAGKSFKSQFRLADKSGARAVLILGEREIENGTVAVKDMKTGQQTDVNDSELLNTLKTMGVMPG